MLTHGVVIHARRRLTRYILVLNLLLWTTVWGSFNKENELEAAVRVMHPVLLIQLTSCTNEHWEDIKKWYADQDYDMEAADGRHAELEKRCSDIHQNDQLCFDDCMFRTHYQMIIIPETRTSYYPIYAKESNLNHLESIILGLNVVTENIVSDDPTKETLATHLKFWCADYYMRLRNEVSKQLLENYDEAGPKLCSELVNESERSIMANMIQCVKHNIKKN